MNKEDINHLDWIYHRMVNVHNENPQVDYLLKFKSIIDYLSKESFPIPQHIWVTPEEALPAPSCDIIFRIENEDGSGDYLYCHGYCIGGIFFDYGHPDIELKATHWMKTPSVEIEKPSWFSKWSKVIKDIKLNK